MQKFFSFRHFIALLCITVGFAQAASAQCGTSTSACSGFKTFTQGGYGGSNGCRGNGPASFMAANFATAFPSGVEIGCGTRKIRLTSAIAVNNFLPSSGTPNLLPAGTLTNPTNYNNTLAGQLVTAKLNVGFDLAFSSFGSNSINLKDLVIASGTFSGWTVAKLIEEADKKIGGCVTNSISFSTYNSALTSINENYDNGTRNNRFLNCPSLVVTGVRGNVSCNGGSNGTINVSVSGGKSPYTYLWSNGATTQDLSGLSAGSYTVTVTDDGGQVRSMTFTISQPAPIQISCSSTNGNCSNGNLGSVSVSANGCVVSSILWSNGATTATVNNLPAGTYSVTVTANNGCTATCTTSVSSVACCNVTEAGSISGGAANCGPFDPAQISGSSAIGGLGSLIYAWYSSENGNDWTLIDGASSESFDPGIISTTTSYKRTARRAGCDTEVSSNVVTMTVNTLPVASVAGGVQNVKCNGAANGSIDLTVTGNAAFTYAWSNGATTEDLSGLAPGSYNVTVTDANGCQATASAEISEPSVLAIGGTTTPVSSCVCNGTATATVSGGTEPYSYVWSTGFTGGAVLQDLCRGAAPKVNVTDANGCKVSFTFNATGFQGGCNGTNIIDFYQGPRADGSPVDADRSNPDLAKGAPENTNLPGSFYSLGFGGYVIVEINAGIYNRPGNDLRIVETTYWAWGCQRYTERARIFISADNVSWTDKGEICQDGEIDIWPLQCVRYVKIVDTSVPESFVNEPVLADGFDLDGIECIGNTAGRAAVSGETTMSEADEIAAAEAAARWITRTVSLTPNPAEGLVNLELSGAKDGERVQMQIIDQVGRVVKSMDISTGAGLFRTEISLDGLSRGIYSVVVKGNELMYTQKLVKK